MGKIRNSNITKSNWKLICRIALTVAASPRIAVQENDPLSSKFPQLVKFFPFPSHYADGLPFSTSKIPGQFWRLTTQIDHQSVECQRREHPQSTNPLWFFVTIFIPVKSFETSNFNRIFGFGIVFFFIRFSKTWESWWIQPWSCRSLRKR